MTRKKDYDTVMRGRALTGLALRVAVAGYMVYLAWKIMSGMLGGSGTIPDWGVYTICIVLTAVAVGFCVYAWKAFCKALKAAEIIPEPETKNGDWGGESGAPGDDTPDQDVNSKL